MKTSDEKLNKWRFEHRRAPVSWRIIGNEVYAQAFIGEAKALLFSVKNALQLNQQPQGEGQRNFVDGTIIRVKCVYGIDYVEIDTSQSSFAEVKPECSITLFNLPTVIPPMKWYASGQETFTKEGDAWVIKDPDGNIEVEGMDYLKTYYRLDLKNCSNCSSLLSTVCETKKLASPTCHPYTYDASKRLYLGEAVPYFQGHPDSTPPVPPDPEDHLIYSFYDSGQAEILKFDHDAQGTYFLWKAYTEWGAYPPTDITFSRTGLGYLLLKLFIQSGGNELCQVETIVKVDCCEKGPNNREIVMFADRATIEKWKKGCGNRGDCEIYERCKEYWNWCEVPPELPHDALQETTSFRARPEDQSYDEGQEKPPGDGSCLPYIWKLNGLETIDRLRTIEGVGTIEEGGNFKESLVYTPPDPIGCQEITITVEDRCKTTYQTHLHCCKKAPELEIRYTSLAMLWGSSQTLQAFGGCLPYIWNLVGIGTLTPSGDGLTALYQAPDTGSCDDNQPVIELRDCCNSIASITIRLTYGGEYYKWRWVLDSALHCPTEYDPYYKYWWYIYRDKKSCLTGEVILSEGLLSFTTATNVSPKDPNEDFCFEEMTHGVLCDYPCTFHHGTTPFCDGCLDAWWDGCCPPGGP
jgi:hypothetical protein